MRPAPSTQRSPSGGRASYSDGESPDASHEAAPTADSVMLVYLLGVLVFMVAAGATVHWLTRPVVLTNLAVAAFGREPRPPTILSSSSWQDVENAEESAVEVALHENEQQGLRPPAVANQGDQHALPPSAKPAALAAVHVPKAKRVAQVRPRLTTPYWRNVWAYAPSGRSSKPAGGFGLWLR